MNVLPASCLLTLLTNRLVAKMEEGRTSNANYYANFLGWCPREFCVGLDASVLMDFTFLCFFFFENIFEGIFFSAKSADGPTLRASVSANFWI